VLRGRVDRVLVGDVQVEEVRVEAFVAECRGGRFAAFLRAGPDEDREAILAESAGDFDAELPESESSREITPTIRNLLIGLDDFPAYALDACYDMLAWNAAADRLMGYIGRMEPEQRNLLRTSFTGPYASQHLEDPQSLAFLRGCVADLRASLARSPKDAKLRALVEELLRASPEFGEMWADHQVAVRRVQTKRVVHEQYGQLEFDCQVLDVPGTAFRLIVYVPEPDSNTAAAFASLSTLTPVTLETPVRRR
jgi:hypothetical protein